MPCSVLGVLPIGFTRYDFGGRMLQVSSVAISLNWVANLAVGLTFPWMLKSMGIGSAYLVYAVLNVACGLFCALLMIETKRQSMHQIQRRLLHES